MGEYPRHARRVLLVNVDCRWNLAIRRMRAYYEDMGAFVDVMDLGFSFYPHKKAMTVDGSGYDFVAVSNIFDTNAERVTVIGCENVIYGGVGSKNPAAQLPDFIEETPPWYGPDEKEAHGFITRGCVRKCYFCKVPRYEGALRPYRDVSEVVGKFRRAVFMDNNILAWSDHMDALRWLNANGIAYQFNQGLDVRLVNAENIAELARAKYVGEYVFALDDARMIDYTRERIRFIREYIPRPYRLKFFVYVGPDMEPSETVERVEMLRDAECLPYLMRDKCWHERGGGEARFYTDLAAWCNQPGIFKKMDFREFLARRHPRNRARQAESWAIWTGSTPLICPVCWQPTIEFDGEACDLCQVTM